jgi:tetratricopeptide (TPR) repeat protein
MKQDPQHLVRQARQFYKQKAYPAALQICSALLDQYGPHADVLTLKALIHLNTQDLPAAGKCIHQALDRNPDHAGMLCTAALINRKLSNFDLAKKQALKSVRQAPDNPKIICQAAMVLGSIGEPQLALQKLEEFVRQTPDQADPWYLIGKFQVDMGNSEAAEFALHRCIELQPSHAVALKLLVRVADPGLSDKNIISLLDNIIEDRVKGADVSIATFALAEIHRKEGHYKKAFSLFQQANTIKSNAQPFDPAGVETYTRKIISNSTGVDLDGKTEGHKGPDIVFITGMPRSGTSLCEQMVSAHSKVVGCGELNKLGRIEQDLQKQGIDLNLDAGRRAVNDVQIARARSDYLAVLPKDPANYRWLTDKSIFNFRRLGFIRALFPSARVLFCVRHPLDTILSCFFRDFRTGGEFSNSLDHLASIYTDHIRIMQHWQEILPGMILMVPYPDMVNDLESQARAIANFLCIDIETAMLKPHLNPRTVKTASNLQVRRPVYDTSLNVWKNYQQELQAVIQYLQQHNILDKDINPVL